MNKKLIPAIIILLIFIVGIAYYLKTNAPKQETTTAENTVVNSPEETPEISSDENTLKRKIAAQLGKKYNKPADSFTIEVLIDTGQFAKGSVRYADQLGGGGLWFAARTEKGWELAFDGNGIMTCDIADKYNLPSDIVSGCIDTQNGNQLKQR